MQMQPERPTNEGRRFPWKAALCVFFSITVFFIVYQVAVVRFALFPVFLVYCIAPIALGLFYALYNYGAPRRNVTRALLPSEWSDEEKDAYLSEAALRKKRSRWALYVLVGLAFSIVYDTVFLFAGDALTPMGNLFESWFGGIL